MGRVAWFSRGVVDFFIGVPRIASCCGGMGLSSFRLGLGLCLIRLRPIPLTAYCSGEVKGVLDGGGVVVVVVVLMWRQFLRDIVFACSSLLGFQK